MRQVGVDGMGEVEGTRLSEVGEGDEEDDGSTRDKCNGDLFTGFGLTDEQHNEAFVFAVVVVGGEEDDDDNVIVFDESIFGDPE